jgi:hypothetical protein
MSALATVPAASAAHCPISTGCINVNFGAVALGATKTKSVTLTNDTTATITVVGVHLINAPANSGFDASTSSCTEPLGPGDSCTADASMTGLVKGHYEGIVDIRTTCTAESWLTQPDVCSTVPDFVLVPNGTTRPS